VRAVVLENYVVARVPAKKQRAVHREKIAEPALYDGFPYQLIITGISSFVIDEYTCRRIRGNQARHPSRRTKRVSQGFFAYHYRDTLRDRYAQY